MTERVVFRFGKFRCSPSRGEVFSGDVPIHLPRRFRLILEALLEAEGGALGKEILDVSSNSRRLGQNICLLRKFLGDADKVVIQTVLGVGYRIGIPVTRSDSESGPTFDAVALGDIATSDLSDTKKDQLAPRLRSPRNFLVKTASDLAPSSVNENSKLIISSGVLAARSIAGFVRAADYADDYVNRHFPQGTGLEGTSRIDAQGAAAFGWIKGAVLGNLDDGLSYIDRAMEIAPGLPCGHVYKAWLLLASKSLDGALREVEHGLASNPKDDSLLFLSGYMLCSAGKFGDLEALLSKALAVHPNNMLLLVLRCVSYGVTGDFKRAERTANFTMRIFPQSTLVVATMAWLKALQGDGSAALRTLSARQKVARGYISPVAVASVYSALGDAASCEAYLAISRIDQDPWRHFTWCDPRFGLSTERARPKSLARRDNIERGD